MGTAEDPSVSLTIAEGHPAAVPVFYESWEDWRSERQSQEALPPAPLVPAGVVFCAMCWGAGRVLAPARNGEGLVPSDCGHCDGLGVVPNLFDG